jgi:chemotaxis family two-component system sensor histidine kinase/response regulator PixL
MLNREELLFTGTYSVHSSALTRGSCVLLVEDDRSLRRYLEILLVRGGYTVVTANDGLEAMRVLLNNSDVDIVLTDAIMPNLSGTELCRFLKNTPQLSDLPIVLLTALEPKQTAQETNGVDAILVKPVANELLFNCLDDLLSQPRFRQRNRQSGVESQESILVLD